ncbi:MAG TPA: sugar ABC transporter permease [Thermomicrobiales bacterium]|jgi:multiple sugar transport system permease protein|nr:sugar ABC transporter permease [Thermomicrobiales bacterium]
MTARTASPSVAKAPREERYTFDNERVLGPLMLAPAIIYIVALVGFPLVLAVLYAFSTATAGDPRIDSWDDFVGLRNFRAVLNDGVFTKALRNTIFFTLASQAIVIVLANILSQIMLADFPGKKIFRFLVMLPWTTPIALSVLGWFWIFDSVYSPIDWLMRQMNLLGPGTMFGPARNMYWLGETELAQGAVLMIHVWRTLPLATVILLGGLTSIPNDINEAADIDGAGFWRKLFYIRLPLLLPIMAIAMLFSMIFTFTDLTVSLVLTRGGPVNDTQVLSSWAYFKGIQGGNLSQGAAVALFMLPVLIAIAIGMLRLARRGAND